MHHPLVTEVREHRHLTRQGQTQTRLTSQRLALHSRIVLAAVEGKSNTEIAADLRVTSTTVDKWRQRFLGDRLEGLADEPRPGAPRTITDAQVEEGCWTGIRACRPCGTRMPESCLVTIPVYDSSLNGSFTASVATRWTSQVQFPYRPLGWVDNSLN